MTKNWLDQSILEYEEDEDFYDVYASEGSERISELSRQIRSYFNFKTAIIQLRYSNQHEIKISSKQESVFNWKEKFTSLSSQLISKLNNLGVNEDRLAEKLHLLLNDLHVNPNKIDLNFLKELKKLNEEIWKVINILSELEVYHHPRLMHLVLRIINIVCITQGVFNNLFSEFYIELRENYSLLRNELESLLQIDNKNRNQYKAKYTKTRVGVKL